MKTHDYTYRYVGHDYAFEPIGGGRRGKATGWGEGIQQGDYLILQNGERGTRYRVESIRYFDDPPDMWSAVLSFAPRSKKSDDQRPSQI
jgi:hypothetical protein